MIDKVFIGAMLAIIAATPVYIHDVTTTENTGKARFQNETLRVDAAAAVQWGVDIDALRSWDVPIEFVDYDADVTFTNGATACKNIPGFGNLCTQAVAQRFLDSERWVESCVITLSSRGAGKATNPTTVAVHEFGHCLGLKHNDTEPSVMGTIMDSKILPNPLWRDLPTESDKNAL